MEIKATSSLIGGQTNKRVNFTKVDVYGTMFVKITDDFGEVGNFWLDEYQAKEIVKHLVKEYKIMNYLDIDQLKKEVIGNITDTLLKANNTVTTLEVKNELRTKYPQLDWSQQYISDFLRSLADDASLTFVDNGTYRTYSVPVVKTPEEIEAEEKALAKLERKAAKAEKKAKIDTLIIKLLDSEYVQGKDYKRVQKLAKLLNIGGVEDDK